MIKQDPGDPFRATSLRSDWNGDLRSEKESAKEPSGQRGGRCQVPRAGTASPGGLVAGVGRAMGRWGWMAGWGTQEVGPREGIGSAVRSPGAF